MRHIVCRVEAEVETDGRWVAEIPDLPGVLAYGSTEKEAVASAQVLALRVLADRIEEQKEPAENVTRVSKPWPRCVSSPLNLKLARWLLSRPIAPACAYCHLGPKN